MATTCAKDVKEFDQSFTKYRATPSSVMFRTCRLLRCLSKTAEYHANL